MGAVKLLAPEAVLLLPNGFTLHADPVLDAALRDRLTYHDPQLDQWRRDAVVLADRHWQGRFAASYLLGRVDERLCSVKASMRNGAPYQEVKVFFEEDLPQRRSR